MPGKPGLVGHSRGGEKKVSPAEVGANAKALLERPWGQAGRGLPGWVRGIFLLSMPWEGNRGSLKGPFQLWVENEVEACKTEMWRCVISM